MPFVRTAINANWVEGLEIILALSPAVLLLAQVELEQHLAESQELEGRLNRALEEKEVKESQVGVISMAIEQLFSRTVNSCRLPQRKKDATDIKFAPVRGNKADVRLEEMFKQIIERVEDLQEMHATVQLSREKQKEDRAAADFKRDLLLYQAFQGLVQDSHRQ
ncbi:unnamed protein product [Effrenium voratum]|nr:unnamed protein product [Effrenium voratum]